MLTESIVRTGHNPIMGDDMTQYVLIEHYNGEYGCGSNIKGVFDNHEDALKQFKDFYKLTHLGEDKDCYNVVEDDQNWGFYKEERKDNFNDFYVLEIKKYENKEKVFVFDPQDDEDGTLTDTFKHGDYVHVSELIRKHPYESHTYDSIDDFVSALNEDVIDTTSSWIRVFKNV